MLFNQIKYYFLYGLYNSSLLFNFLNNCLTIDSVGIYGLELFKIIF